MEKGMLDLARFKGEWKGQLLLLSELIPSTELHDPCESKEQVQSEEKRREAGCLKRAMLQANPEAQ